MEPASSTPPALACLDGAIAPAEIVADLARVAALPPAARDSLWEVLGPSLEEPLPAEVERRLDDYCVRHRVPDADLARALKACRFLLREAAKLDLDARAFADDVALVSPDPGVQRLLAAGYDRAKTAVRQQILRAVLTEHGQVLTGVDWRADTVTASSHGARISIPLAVLTLRHQDGERAGRTTLHAPLAMIAQLRDACDAILASRPDTTQR